jgi:nicotinate-nucleotide adenylyltransferase
MSKRVGVYGGMFDPVHCGHLAVAELALEALSLDHVLLVPCKLPNHRHAASATGAQRLDMLTLACADSAQLVASSIELEREGISYSIDTLAQLKNDDPSTDFVFVLGRDAFVGLPLWDRWERLLDENLLAVVSRPGISVSRESAELTQLASRMVRSPEALFDGGRGKIILLEELQNHLSSTRVRAALSGVNGRNQSTDMRLDDWLPDTVRAYIETHDLYRYT